MLTIKILNVGKTKEKWLEEAIQEYTKRLKGFLKISWIFLRDSSHLLKQLGKEKFYICLDLRGKELTSEEFSKKIFHLIEKGGSNLTLVIGGADGLCETVKKGAFDSFCLSKLTFTHQITRLILIEQIYRAFKIAKGSNYHK